MDVEFSGFAITLQVFKLPRHALFIQCTTEEPTLYLALIHILGKKLFTQFNNYRSYCEITLK